MADDRILLEGMTFYGFHGVAPEEKALGQRFVVDVEVSADLAAAGQSDDLEQTINYARVHRLVKEIVEGPSLNLIEAVAERIAAAVLGLARVEAVRVRVHKPWAPIKGSTTATAAVEITRRAKPGPDRQ